MNYELAKQLKDAGFPIITYGVLENQWNIPSLSELIDACGKQFWQLRYYKKRGDYCEKDMWMVESHIGHFATAKTPKEAVAKLWIKLCKN